MSRKNLKQNVWTGASVLLMWFFLFVGFASAQTFEIVKGDTINRTDAAGMKQGLWVINNKTRNLPEFSSDQVIEEVHFVDGKKNGIRKLYYPNGKVKSEINYINNIPKGFSRLYYANGNVSEEGNWKNGGWDGAYYYFYENGKPCYEWMFKDGKRSGQQKYYFQNGELNYIGMWKDGNESGVLKEYNEAGLLVAEKNYSEGRLDETTTKYYSTPVAEKTEPRRDKSADKSQDDVGTFTGSGFYSLKNKDGLPLREGTFKNGILLEGKQFQYNNDGRLARTIIYKDGKISQTLEEKR